MPSGSLEEPLWFQSLGAAEGELKLLAEEQVLKVEALAAVENGGEGGQ